jgi:hypothetical protein
MPSIDFSDFDELVLSRTFGSAERSFVKRGDDAHPHIINAPISAATIHPL